MSFYLKWKHKWSRWKKKGLAHTVTIIIIAKDKGLYSYTKINELVELE